MAHTRWNSPESSNVRTHQIAPSTDCQIDTYIQLWGFGTHGSSGGISLPWRFTWVSVWLCVVVLGQRAAVRYRPVLSSSRCGPTSPAPSSGPPPSLGLELRPPPPPLRTTPLQSPSWMTSRDVRALGHRHRLLLILIYCPPLTLVKCCPCWLINNYQDH